jgi:hypothetical protein
VSVNGWEDGQGLHRHCNLNRVWLGYTNRNFHRVGVTDWNRNFNWVGTINRYLNRDVHWHFNGVRLRDRDLPLNVHRVWSFYRYFNREGVRDRYFHFNRVGTFDRDWYLNWDSFYNSDRSVYDNWVRMIDRDFDLNRVGVRDGNWDLNGVWLRFRNSNWDFDRVGMVNTHWDFHRDGSINWHSNFNGEGVRDWIRYLNWYRVLDTNWVGLWNFNSFFDYLLGPEAAWVETAQLVSWCVVVVACKAVTVSMCWHWHPPLRGVAFCRCRNHLGCLCWTQTFWPCIGTRNGSQTDGEDAQLW